jgi:NSS family neurotransmitter:Na+ symporter
MDIFRKRRFEMSTTDTAVPTGKAEAAPQKREHFATKVGIVMATLGSAVGLGNIWKFPYLTGTNGGAVFILFYIICVVLIGIPVMVAELSIGRTARANAYGAMKAAAPTKPFWWVIGVFGIFCAFIIMAYYSEVAGWVASYIFQSVSGGILSTDPAVTTAAFTNMVVDPTGSVVWQWVDLVIVGAILLFGVSKGIENATKRLIPVLLGLLVIVAVRSVTLPGAGQGLTYLFRPDFSAVNGPMLLTALGLAFFKLSIGMGIMITYGSYYRNDQNIPGTAVRVAFSDMGIALLAGIAIFPAVFAYGFEPNAGASLLFITIPSVFASMPAGNIFMVLFFVLTYIASIGAQLSLVEVTVTYMNERFHLSRKVGTLITVAAIGVVGVTAALSNSSMANVTLFGKTFFDLFDYASSNVLMPLGGLLVCVFVGWVWGYKNYKAAVTNEGSVNKDWIAKGLFFITKWIAPVLVLVVMLNGFGVFG